MNYYPHHIGDYLKDTAHLSMLEDGAYRRLIDLYYQHEQALPGDKKQIYRLARAFTAPEKRAIDTILNEYFVKLELNWHHKRCDEELSRSREKSEKAKQSVAARWNKKSNENNALLENPVTNPYENSGNNVSNLNTNVYTNVSNSNGVSYSERNTNPITNNQKPITNKEKTNKKEDADTGEPAGTDGVCSPPGVVPIETEKLPPPGRPTDIPSAPPATSPYGAICAYVRSQRMLASPSDQAFRDLVDSGASMLHFVDAVAVAQSKGKGWGYLLGIVRNQLEHEKSAVAKAKPSAGPPAAPVRLFRKGWDSSPFGVHEVGAELGIPKREDEDEIQYRDRMRLAVKERETPGQQRSVA